MAAERPAMGSAALDVEAREGYFCVELTGPPCSSVVTVSQRLAALR